MAFGSSSAGIRSDINITPLVDVVLVMLIIFMVATPLTQMGYGVQVPPKVETAVPTPSQDQIIVRAAAFKLCMGVSSNRHTRNARNSDARI